MTPETRPNYTPYGPLHWTLEHRFGPEAFLAPATYPGGRMEPVPAYVLAQGRGKVMKWCHARDNELRMYERYMFMIGVAFDKEAGRPFPDCLKEETMARAAVELKSIRIAAQQGAWANKPLPEDASRRMRFYKVALQGREIYEQSSPDLSPTPGPCCAPCDEVEAFLHCSETPPPPDEA